MLDIEKIRGDFPILHTTVNDRPLVYLDNAATTQLPVCVMERLRHHYCFENANVHRGIHTLSEKSTSAFEEARETVKNFINAEYTEEIIFTQGTTDSINLAAEGMRRQIREGDVIVVTQLEHHSNFLPWQRLCEETGAAFHVVPCPDGIPDMQVFAEKMRLSPKLVAAAHVSNLTGTVLPVKKIEEMSHKAGALFLIDGAQGIRHEAVDVRELNCDFYCFSGHKVMAPGGIGVLYGKKELLETLRPFRMGGGMVDRVTEQYATYGPLPTRLEAGTPNYPGAIGLAAALSWLEQIGKEEIRAYERSLMKDVEEKLSQIEGIRILGHPQERVGAISFVIENIHPYDAASVLDKYGVALRSGNHCAQPALAQFGETAALRMSPAFYNTYDEIAAACNAIEKTMEMFAKWMKH